MQITVRWFLAGVVGFSCSLRLDMLGLSIRSAMASVLHHIRPIRVVCPLASVSVHPLLLSMDDFRGIATPARKRPREATGSGSQEAGQERQYLRVFETAPSQMLNAYGEARHFKMEDAAVWDAVSGPLKTGAAWMTEYASPEAERRGIAINRYLKSLEDYLLYQRSEKGMRTNEYVLKPAIFAELNAEVERLLPIVQYCLAPKKVSQKTGAASLRSTPVSTPTTNKTAQELDAYSEKLWEWLDTKNVSRVRMLMTYQAAGGLPFVACCHHRVTQCFRYHGATKHSDSGAREITLQQWQESIRVRHSLGSNGVSSSGNADETERDFKELTSE